VIHVPTRAITAPFAAALAPSAASFARALRDPKRAQTAALQRISREVRALSGVTSLAQLRSLPITTYDDVADDIDVIARGGRTRLTRSPVVRFERSGGSSGAQKLLPMTAPFLAEMNRALLPWLFSLYAPGSEHAGVARGSAYWSISPLGDVVKSTPAGIPIGSDSDSAYFAPLVRGLVDRVLAVPSEQIAKLDDVDEARLATLRFLIARDDLALISVWSPTFLTLLMRVLDDNLDALLDHLARTDAKRAQRLRDIARVRRVEPRDLWPRLALISLWTDAAAARFVDDVVARFAGVAIEPKGLLAVEGVVSLPWPGDVAPVLAVNSHVLEFLDDDGRAHFAHEIERDKTYEVLLTTSAGLVRYRLGDRVTVVGRAHATPRVRFVGRAGMVSDLVGEKLSAAFVGAVLDRIVPHAKFAMLAPTTTPKPRYALYLEVEAALTDAAHAPESRVARSVESALCEGHPYRYARQLGQLDCVEVVRVVDGMRAYEAACISRGQRAGDIKPTPLFPSLDVDWRRAFSLDDVGLTK
jgi:hypothetical protein